MNRINSINSEDSVSGGSNANNVHIVKGTNNSNNLDIVKGTNNSNNANNVYNVQAVNSTVLPPSFFVIIFSKMKHSVRLNKTKLGLIGPRDLPWTLER